MKTKGSPLASGDAEGEAEGETSGEPVGVAEGVASGEPEGDASGDSDAPGDAVRVASGEDVCAAAGEGVNVSPSPVPFGDAVGTVPAASLSSAVFGTAVGVGVAVSSPVAFGEASDMLPFEYDAGVMFVSDTDVTVFAPEGDTDGDAVSVFLISAARVGNAHVTIRPNASSQAVIRFIGLGLLFFCSLATANISIFPVLSVVSISFPTGFFK